MSFTRLRNKKVHDGMIEWGNSAQVYPSLLALLYSCLKGRVSMNYPIYMIIFFLILFTIIFYATSNSKIAERKMTMIILSKDKTKCAEYNRITVQRSYAGSKDKKYAVVGCVNHHDDILEYYPDKESAVKELEKIFAAYQNGEKTYTL